MNTTTSEIIMALQQLQASMRNGVLSGNPGAGVISVTLDRDTYNAVAGAFQVYDGKTNRFELCGIVVRKAVAKHVKTKDET